MRLDIRTEADIVRTSTDEERDMTKQQARKIDQTFYVEFDDESGLYCVFGDNSGFAYKGCSTAEQAYEEMSKM